VGEEKFSQGTATLISCRISWNAYWLSLREMTAVKMTFVRLFRGACFDRQTCWLLRLPV